MIGLVKHYKFIFLFSLSIAVAVLSVLSIFLLILAFTKSRVRILLVQFKLDELMITTFYFWGYSRGLLLLYYLGIEYAFFNILRGLNTSYSSLLTYLLT